MSSSVHGHEQKDRKFKVSSMHLACVSSQSHFVVNLIKRGMVKQNVRFAVCPPHHVGSFPRKDDHFKVNSPSCNHVCYGSCHWYCNGVDIEMCDKVMVIISRHHLKAFKASGFQGQLIAVKANFGNNSKFIFLRSSQKSHQQVMKPLQE